MKSLEHYQKHLKWAEEPGVSKQISEALRNPPGIKYLDLTEIT